MKMISKFNSLHNYFTIYFNDFEKFNKIELLNYFNLVKVKIRLMLQLF